MKCPRCWADKAYLREYSGWYEFVLGCLAFRPMKCSHCYHRFVVHWLFTIGEQVVPPVLRVTRHGRAERRSGSRSRRSSSSSRAA